MGVNTATADRPSTDRRQSCQNPQSDLACMACNCFNEAGNQSYDGQVAVGKVVQTRRYLFASDRKYQAGRPARYAASVCGVIKQKSQFSWWDAPGAKSRKSVPAKHRCFMAARESLQFWGFFADHYHADYVKPKWARQMVKQRTIGDHIFYAYARDVRSTPRIDREQRNSNPQYNWWGNTFALLDTREGGL